MTRAIRLPSRTAPRQAPAATSASGDAPEVTAGQELGGFRVERVVRAHPGSWTVAEAAPAERSGAPQPSTLTLWISPRGAADDPQLAGRFDRLAELSRRSDAAEVPLVLPQAAVHDGSRLVLARAPLRGQSLAARLASGPLPRAETARVVSQLAGALDTLRAYDLPHAPLTPERVLLTTRGPARALLHDYGFVLAPAPAGARGALLDAADYLAPELARGEPQSAATDVYALACVLVECLTGVPPFPYDMPLAVLHAHAVEPVPAIAEHAGLPPELDRLLRTALDKRPEQRQRTAAALARGAQRALGRERPPIPVAVPAPVRRPTERAADPPAPSRPAARRRWPVPSSVGIAVTLVAASTAGFAAARMQPGTSDRPAPRAALATPAERAAEARLAYAATTARVVRRLDADRARARAALQAAGDAATQARVAGELAAAYGTAVSQLGRPPAGAPSPEPALSQAHRAYRRLAAAARLGDTAGYSAAASDVQRSERQATAALRAVTGGGPWETA